MIEDMHSKHLSQYDWYPRKVILLKTNENQN